MASTFAHLWRIKNSRGEMDEFPVGVIHIKAKWQGTLIEFPGNFSQGTPTAALVLCMFRVVRLDQGLRKANSKPPPSSFIPRMQSNSCWIKSSRIESCHFAGLPVSCPRKQQVRMDVQTSSLLLRKGFRWYNVPNKDHGIMNCPRENAQVRQTFTQCLQCVRT